MITAAQLYLGPGKNRLRRCTSGKAAWVSGMRLLWVRSRRGSAATAKACPWLRSPTPVTQGRLRRGEINSGHVLGTVHADHHRADLRWCHDDLPCFTLTFAGTRPGGPDKKAQKSCPVVVAGEDKRTRRPVMTSFCGRRTHLDDGGYRSSWSAYPAPSASACRLCRRVLTKYSRTPRRG